MKTFELIFEIIITILLGLFGITLTIFCFFADYSEANIAHILSLIIVIIGVWGILFKSFSDLYYDIKRWRKK